MGRRSKGGHSGQWPDQIDHGQRPDQLVVFFVIVALCILIAILLICFCYSCKPTKSDWVHQGGDRCKKSRNKSLQKNRRRRSYSSDVETGLRPPLNLVDPAVQPTRTSLQQEHPAIQIVPSAPPIDRCTDCQNRKVQKNRGRRSYGDDVESNDGPHTNLVDPAGTSRQQEHPAGQVDPSAPTSDRCVDCQNRRLQKNRGRRGDEETIELPQRNLVVPAVQPTGTPLQQAHPSSQVDPDPPPSYSEAMKAIERQSQQGASYYDPSHHGWSYHDTSHHYSSYDAGGGGDAGGCDAGGGDCG